MKKLIIRKYAFVSTENVLFILVAVVALLVIVGIVNTGIKAISTTTQINNITKQNNSKMQDVNKYNSNYSYSKTNVK